VVSLWGQARDRKPTYRKKNASTTQKHEKETHVVSFDCDDVYTFTHIYVTYVPCCWSSSFVRTTKTTTELTDKQTTPNSIATCTIPSTYIPESVHSHPRSVTVEKAQAHSLHHHVCRFLCTLGHNDEERTQRRPPRLVCLFWGLLRLAVLVFPLCVCVCVAAAATTLFLDRVALWSECCSPVLLFSSLYIVL
jgi:hypothetical protein